MTSFPGKVAGVGGVHTRTHSKKQLRNKRVVQGASEEEGERESFRNSSPECRVKQINTSFKIESGLATQLGGRPLAQLCEVLGSSPSTATKLKSGWDGNSICFPTSKPSQETTSGRRGMPCLALLWPRRCGSHTTQHPQCGGGEVHFGSRFAEV